jgi:diadenosine tetraphosphate (Ap4A) HIT family hydrolase
LETTNRNHHQSWHFIGDHYRPDKINIGMLGNQVPQLHVHVIGRFESDPAWPGGVWSCEEKQPYAAARVSQVRRLIRPWLDVSNCPDEPGGLER